MGAQGEMTELEEAQLISYHMQPSILMFPGCGCYVTPGRHKGSHCFFISTPARVLTCNNLHIQQERWYPTKAELLWLLENQP